MQGNSPTVTIRVPHLWLAAIKAAIDELNQDAATYPKFTLTSWFLKCVDKELHGVYAAKAPLLTVANKPKPAKKATKPSSTKRKTKSR